jgi:proteasome lid subunit RPN8/RPN11
MTEMTESGALETWSTAGCPFTIEYSRRVLDDIRLAVVDAFFSLPRGGAEIGGVLLGRFAQGRVTIVDYAPLECEHIFGPSFTLSPGDHARLAEILSSGPMSDLQPVGWYHSHTRSDIFLSEADLDICNRYFPEPWQVALVLRPSTFQPVQAGFFFREPDGSIHTGGSYQEFALDPLPVGQVPRGMPAAIPQPAHRPAEPEGPMITLVPEPVITAAPEPMAVTGESEPLEPFAAPAAETTPPPRAVPLPPALPPLPILELVPEPGNDDEPIPELSAAVELAPGLDVAEAPEAVEAAETPVEPEPPAETTWLAPAETPFEQQPQLEPTPAAEAKPAPQPEPKTDRQAAEPPSFQQVEPVRSRRRLWVVGTIAATVAIFAGGYQQRDSWLPQVIEFLPQRAASAEPAPVPLTLPLSATDQQGQLQIRWDSAAPAVTKARDAVLRITDDGATTDLPLDAPHLQGGAFTYVRHGEHVDARLTVQEMDGTQIHTVTSFFGPLPEPVKPVGADPALRQPNSDLAKKNAELARQNGDLQARLNELTKETSKLKKDLAGRAETGKQSAELARQNTEFRQQRDDLAKQTAKLKADLARATTAKQKANAARPIAELTQQRDDLLIQITKLKTELAARTAATKQSPNPPAANAADFSKQRYALVNQVSQLQSDLAVAKTRADKLSRQLDDLRKQQLQRRLQNQSGDPSQ